MPTRASLGHWCLVICRSLGLVRGLCMRAPTLAPARRVNSADAFSDHEMGNKRTRASRLRLGDDVLHDVLHVLRLHLGGGLILAPDGLVHLLAVHGHAFWRVDTEADFVAADVDHRDLDALVGTGSWIPRAG